MKKIEVIIQMEKAATARTEWATRKREFDSNYDRVMLRLVYEGLAIRMTAAEMAHAASIPTSRMRDFMKRHGIKPSERRTVLSDLAGHALKTNAELLGIDPVNMDLTSPLAYLPMGNALRTQLQDAEGTRPTVEEFEEAATDAAEYAEKAERYYDMLIKLGFCPKDGESLPCMACGAGL